MSGRGGIDANVRAASYLIAQTVAACPRCRAATRLLAVALPPLHQTLDEEGLWESTFSHAFLFHIARLPQTVQRRLREQVPAYGLDRCPSSGECHWVNHCERCAARLEDQDLYCEPQGAFCPVSPARASAILLVPMADPIEAWAAGYAFEPQYFESMRRA